MVEASEEKIPTVISVNRRRGKYRKLNKQVDEKARETEELWLNKTRDEVEVEQHRDRKLHQKVKELGGIRSQKRKFNNK